MKEVMANGPEGWVVVGTWNSGPAPPPLLCLPPGLSFFMCNNKTLRNGLLTHATMCTVLSERGQTQKATYCTIPFIRFFEEEKKKVQR